MNFEFIVGVALFVFAILLFAFLVFYMFRMESAEKTKRLLIEQQRVDERSRMAKQIDWLCKKEDAQVELRRMELEFKMAEQGGDSAMMGWLEKFMPVIQPHLSKLLNNNNDIVLNEVVQNGDSARAETQTNALSHSDSDSSEPVEQVSLSTDLSQSSSSADEFFNRNPEFKRMAETGELDNIIKVAKPFIPKVKKL